MMNNLHIASRLDDSATKDRSDSKANHHYAAHSRKYCGSGPIRSSITDVRADRSGDGGEAAQEAVNGRTNE